MKPIVFILHVIPHSLNHVCESCEISQMRFFQGVDRNYVVNRDFDKQSF
jgi:hypothetical protein